MEAMDYKTRMMRLLHKLSGNKDVGVGLLRQQCLEYSEWLNGFNHCLSQWAAFLDIVVFNPDFYCSFK